MEMRCATGTAVIVWGRKDSIAIGNYLFNPNRQTLTDNTEEKTFFRESEPFDCCMKTKKIIDRRDILNVLWAATFL